MLNVVPKIMTAALKPVPKKDAKIKGTTVLRIDDIMIEVTKVSVEDKVDHLKKFGLVTKPPESLNEGAVLGLELKKEK